MQHGREHALVRARDVRQKREREHRGAVVVVHVPDGPAAVEQTRDVDRVRQRVFALAPADDEPSRSSRGRGGRARVARVADAERGVVRIANERGPRDPRARVGEPAA
eukprot:30918-Pelagococcus_subviridis.AAC.81